MMQCKVPPPKLEPTSTHLGFHLQLSHKRLPMDDDGLFALQNLKSQVAMEKKHHLERPDVRVGPMGSQDKVQSKFRNSSTPYF